MKIPALLIVGVNHLSAPVSCRERTAVLEPDLPGVLVHIMNLAGLEETVILSTCSRVEVIATAHDPDATSARLKDWFLSRAGAQAASVIYIKRDAEAIQHLFRVTAGLDSWIIGEAEIQGQVRRAYQLAFDLRATGRILNRVFQRALSAGKSIRTQTGIQNGIHSIGGAAALLAKRIFDDAQRGRVVVFGAGEVAEAVARHLAAKNFKEVWVANRTLERARAVAGPLGGEAVTFEQGIRNLAEAEVAVFSTSCPRVLLDAHTLKPMLKDRKRPLFLIDLGLPRNVEPGCAELPGVYLYNLDDLKEIVRESMTKKAVEKDSAEVFASSASAECVKELEKSEARRTQTYLMAGRAL